MKPTDFYYVRHGQTMFNVQHRLQGKCDSPLTEKGIADAFKAELALRKIPFDRAFCSSSERCVDTAAMILERHNVRAIPLKGLKEVDFGNLDGSLFDEVREAFERYKAEDNFGEVGGETGEEIRDRILRTFREIALRSQPGEKVLVVSHGSYGVHVLGTLFGVDTGAFIAERKKICPDQYAFPNGGIMKFRWEDGKWRLLCFPVEPENFIDCQ
ncbi:MAG: histidine phosphatase family protein [Solobacterium sp.]|nr:histidine phosphatase family protein [Solobacterium sp.]